MAYRPPHKRNSVLTHDLHGSKSIQKTVSKVIPTPKKEEFPSLVPVKADAIKAETVKAEPDKPIKPKMDFSSLFKNVEKKKQKPKKLKWGTVLLTKKGRIDSMTSEEREEEEKWKIQQGQDNKLLTMAERLIQQQNVRRVFDPHYESPDELTVSASEEDPEEEEVLTDEVDEDEFEPEI
jgi:hypothetical protein